MDRELAVEQGEPEGQPFERVGVRVQTAAALVDRLHVARNAVDTG